MPNTNASNLPSTSANLMNQSVGAMTPQNTTGIGMSTNQNVAQRQQSQNASGIGMNANQNVVQRQQQTQNPTAAMINQMNPGSIQMKQNQQLGSGTFSGGNAITQNALAQQRQVNFPNSRFINFIFSILHLYSVYVLNKCILFFD